jgi:predicted AlkP superfamily pyrophosphatase or phosphodiesterase
LKRAALFGCVLGLAASGFVIHPQAQMARPAAGAPQLLVLLVVDQMRGDYVDKFQQQWSHGLRRMVTEGAWFRQAEYPYFNTLTCAGHASIGTGAVPSIHGMILNGWWERETKKQVACTDDDKARTISYGKPIATAGESAVRLRTTTLADELRAQLDPIPHIAAFSLKARSAVTLGGQRPDAIAWFDDAGAWVTSTAFSKGPVPAVADFIARNPVEKDFGKAWDRALPKDAYFYEAQTVGLRPGRAAMTPSFPHIVKGSDATPGRVFYDQWQSSPFADEYLARMGAAVNEALNAGPKAEKNAARSERNSGQDSTRAVVGKSAQHAGSNLLAISFSSLDKVGHDYGPHSHEVQDILIRLDRTLGDLFAALDRQVGAGNYTVALSADHGVSPVPERLLAMGIDAGRISTEAVVSRAEKSMTASLGPGKHVLSLLHDYLYLEPGVVEQLRSRPDALRALLGDLREVKGIQQAYWRDDLEANHFDADPMGRRAAFSFDRDRSGDVMLVFKPYWIASSGTTTHGSGYAYDTHVPLLLMGKGIAPGQYLQPASPTDVAPTLAFLAGVTLPRASGRVLVEALDHRATR